MKYATPEGINPGDTFGLLTVVKFVGRNARHQALFAVKCACGSLSEVLGTNLKKGNSTRCDAGVHKIVHGLINTAEYVAWKAMNWRVKSKHPMVAPYYRDKGITVYEEWRKSFTSFLAHIGAMPRPGLTVDRIDGRKNYEPGNVRWATRREQMENTERAVDVTIDGETHCISEWSRRSGIPLPTLCYRVRRGWPTNQILSKEKGRHRVGRCV